MGADAQVVVSGEISRILPQGKGDNQESGPARMWRYDEQVMVPLLPDMAALAEEGTYWTVNNNQTGIATAAAPTAFSATNPFLLIYNTAVPSNPLAPRIVLDYANLLATAAGTAGASVQFAVSLDQGNRYTSGGTEISNQVTNPNGDVSGNKSVAKIWAGNITAAAASTAVRSIVGNRYMKGAIPVAGDTYTIKFGGVDAPHFFGISTILFSVNNVPKVVIPPNWSCLIHLWLPSQSGASSYAPELGWYER